MTMRKTTLALSLAVTAFALACGDSKSDVTPDDDGGGVFTNPDNGNKDAGTGSAGGKDASATGGNTEDDAGGGETGDDAGTPVDEDGGVCSPTENADGFYLCKPTTNLQFLNQYVDPARGISQPKFDNQARIPGYTGTLPTLP